VVGYCLQSIFKTGQNIKKLITAPRVLKNTQKNDDRFLLIRGSVKTFDSFERLHFVTEKKSAKRALYEFPGSGDDNDEKLASS